MKNATESLQHNAENLIKNIRSLIEEAESTINGDLADKSEEALAQLRDRLEDGLDKLSEYYDAAKERVRVGAKATDETIRSYPYQSIAIALGVGLIVGALFRQRS